MGKLYLAMLLSVSAGDVPPPTSPPWDPEVVTAATESVAAIQKSCDEPHPAQARFNVLEEIYVKAEESKKVPSLQILNGNKELHDRLTATALSIPIQYYDLYILLSGFQCEVEGVIITKFKNI
jgi:hypothetical protein